MFAYFTTNKTLRNRIHDLERTIEILTGTNNILERELGESKGKEERLLEKVFQVAGISDKKSQDIKVPPSPDNFISMGRKGLPWAKAREVLETKALENYWEAKKAAEESKGKVEESM